MKTYWIYRVTPDKHVEFMDELNETFSTIEDYMRDFYLPDAADGERYFAVNKSRGEVEHEWEVHTQRKLVELKPRVIGR